MLEFTGHARCGGHTLRHFATITLLFDRYFEFVLLLLAIFFVFTALFGGLSTLFDGLGTLLRFKATLGCSPFFSSISELTRGALEGAIVLNVVAEVEIEIAAHGDSGLPGFLLLCGLGLDNEAAVLDLQSALSKPVVLSHALNKTEFDVVGGLLGFDEAVEEFVE